MTPPQKHQGKGITIRDLNKIILIIHESLICSDLRGPLSAARRKSQQEKQHQA